MPRFSIIVPHFQGSTTHDDCLRGLASLQAQTFKDFEILLYHDGPLLDSSVSFPIPITCMDKNYKDWGHTIRHRGIYEAKGDYILHFNADNILYPNALEEISAVIDRPTRIFLHGNREKPIDNNYIIIFPILMHGLQAYLTHLIPMRDHPEYTLLMTGQPPILANIDAMQFVMHRKLWLIEGGWTDRSYNADGKLYPLFAAKYGYRNVAKVLGEHF